MPITNHFSAILVAFAMAGFVIMMCAGGCQSADTSSSNQPAPVSPTQVPFETLFNRWSLVALGDEPIEVTPPISLLIDTQGRVSGRSAVNGYSSAVSLAALPSSAFTLAPIASTMMAGPPERMDLEARYFKALAEVTHWRIEGANLILTDGSKTLVRFKPAPVE